MRGALSFNDVVYKTKGKTPFVLSIKKWQATIGEKTLLIGPSGSGKTTLLNLLTGVLPPSSGRINILDTDYAILSHRQRDHFRGDHFGIIFQTFNLVPYASVLENIKLGVTFSKIRKGRLTANIDTCAKTLMEKLNLDGGQLANRPAYQLSIGQQQRVAAARALIGSPEILIADEPTSALDNANQKDFLNLFLDSMDMERQCLVMVSHDERLATFFDHVLPLESLMSPGDA